MPTEARSLRLSSQLSAPSMKGSSDIRQPNDPDGNIAQRELAGNFDEPS